MVSYSATVTWQCSSLRCTFMASRFFFTCSLHSLHVMCMVLVSSLALTAPEIAKLETEIIKFSGRIERDGWVKQAKELMAK